jgi:3-deoxy-manno-octulosonate cytidylyltransferase (CMP-KDO synthetase)
MDASDMKTLIVIPARMQATRLPNKPMAMIAGEPMIVQVWRRAMESGVGDVVVACDGEEIAAAIRAVGGVAMITNPDHPSGSDRVWEAVETTAKSYDIIINLQGDVPTLEPRLLHEILVPLADSDVDIATLAAVITDPEEHHNTSVVKVVLGALKDASYSVVPPPLRGRLGGGASNFALNPEAPPSNLPPRGGEASRAATSTHRALYFSRASVPANDGPRYHHIGVYAYRREALRRFVSLPPSPLELREKLEQLRALEAGMRIDARVVDTVPLGVDTPEDLTKARKLMGGL